ncbi:tRNA (guanine-N1)-methyltransferase [Robertkochia aurantiaca]|uniref:tRNA (guanine-N1)-methyltransferase n=1 Tax=Robertkochia aurantiaca TaxID=2873700 RepID=UPI001CCDA3D1|nr:tRNA (guanine-N1)-methyltransferase [Robertkochia sp. 3YJGBD-33]
MKMTIKNLFTVLTMLLLASGSLFAQSEADDENTLQTGDIDDQFEFVINKSNRYKNYKVIKTESLNLLRRNVLDTVARLEKELASEAAITAKQDAEIDGLKRDLASSNDQLAQVTNEKDSISFFGALINKPTYKAIMWGLIALLTLVLLLFIYKFKNANTITREARQNLAELESEYEEHRRKALEREQKARRALQDEINKQKMAKSK